MAPVGDGPRVTASLFGVAFGLAGLAQSWSTAAALTAAPAWPGEGLWLLTAAVWLVTAITHLRALLPHARWRAALTDPVHAPFSALACIVPMMLAVALSRHSHALGRAAFLTALIATLLAGGWLTGSWILTDLPPVGWHSGYYLPGVAGGLLAATGCAAFGDDQAARCLFGYGTACWLALGPILLARLFTQPPLPVALRPTMAIELAPPAVAGNAWFAINGGQVDTLALMLAGYALAMLTVQLRLIPAYRRLPFAPSWWAFAFPAAAACTLTIRWLTAENAPHRQACTHALLAALTTAITALLAATAIRLADGTLIPPPTSTTPETRRPDTPDPPASCAAPEDRNG